MKKDDDKKGVRGEAEAPVEAPKVTEALRAENAELLADLQRTRADFENYRKQVEIQRDAAVRMGQLSTVRRVLPLLDDIDRAIQTYTELAPLKKSLEKTLTSLDLVKIPAEVGMEFDP